MVIQGFRIKAKANDRRWRRIGVITLGSMSLALLRCSPTPPPTPPPAMLEVWHTDSNGNKERVFARDLPGYNAAFGNGELEVVPLLPLFDVATQSSPMSIEFLRNLANPRYLPPGGYFTKFKNQADVLAFARDPQEIFDTLRGLTDDDFGWQQNTSLSFFPNVVGIASPNRFGAYFAAAPTPEGDFFPFYTSNPPQDTAASPLGSGSIKAIRVYQRGLCSAVQPLGGIISTVANNFVSSFIDPKGTVCSGHPIGTTLSGTVFYTNATSYLAHNEGQIGDLRGGFRLASGLQVYDRSGFVNSCSANFNEGYQLGLTDGRLSAFPESPPRINAQGNRVLCTGFGPYGGVVDTLFQGLLFDIPNGILGGSTDQQSYPGGNDGPDVSPFGSCDPAAFDPCSSATRTLERGIFVGGDTQGLSRTEEAQLVAVASRRDVNEVLTNWRCVNRPFGPTVNPDTCAVTPGHDSYRCEYLVKATRINVLPAEVELVFFDDVKQFNAEALPLYYASFASTDPTKPPPGPGALCSRRPNDNPFVDDHGPVIFTTAFANVHHPLELCQGPFPPPPPCVPRRGNAPNTAF